MLAEEIAAIARKMYDSSAVSILFDEAEEGFKRPSLYFPPVEQTPRGSSLSTFGFDNVLYIKLFGETTRSAMEAAQKIAYQIAAEKNLIPLVNESGAATGRVLRLKEISCKKVDTAAAQLTVRWLSVYAYTEETGQQAANFIANMSLK